MNFTAVITVSGIPTDETQPGATHQLKSAVAFVMGVVEASATVYIERLRMRRS